jgi:hypothetical protein
MTKSRKEGQGLVVKEKVEWMGQVSPSAVRGSRSGFCVAQSRLTGEKDEEERFV